VVIKKAHFNNNDKKFKNIEKEIGTPIEIGYKIIYTSISISMY